MKPLAFVFTLISTVAVFHLASAAEEPGIVPSNIAIIDVRAVTSQSLAVQSIRDQLQNLRKKYADEIAQEQGLLRKAEQELKEKRNTLGEEALSKKSRDFEKRAAALQSLVLGHKEQLEKTYNKAMEEFQTKLVQKVSSYSEESGVAIVLKRSQVFLAERDLDITDEILAQLNKELPKIKLEVPKIGN